MGLRVLLVVGDATPGGLAADASGQWMNDFLISLGHTVTPYDDANNAPATVNADYDLIWIGNSVPQITDLAIKGYDACTVPRFATGVRSPHTNYASAAVTTNATASASQYLKTQGLGHPVVPSDLTVAQTVTLLDTAFSPQRYTLDTALGAGQQQIMCRISSALNNICYSVYESGAAIASGVAPARMAWWTIHPGSMGTNVRGKQMMELLVNWLANYNPTPPVDYSAVAKHGNDNIFSELTSQGFTAGSIMDRERQRLLALTGASSVGNSTADLYKIAGERPRI